MKARPDRVFADDCHESRQRQIATLLLLLKQRMMHHRRSSSTESSSSTGQRRRGRNVDSDVATAKRRERRLRHIGVLADTQLSKIEGGGEEGEEEGEGKGEGSRRERKRRGC